jgi:hypothetical protein
MGSSQLDKKYQEKDTNQQPSRIRFHQFRTILKGNTDTNRFNISVSLPQCWNKVAQAREDCTG